MSADYDFSQQDAGDPVELTSRSENKVAANDRYHFLQRIEAGSYAEVWLGHDNLLNQKVAIKKLHPYLTDRPGILDALRTEVDGGRTISSRNVLKIYDLTHIDRHTCLVMEYVKGKNLQELFATNRPSSTQLFTLVLQLASGLAAIHENGFGHRDLKPENVLLDETGRLIIGDLGQLTDIAGEQVSSTRIPYLAPELFRVPSSRRSDIYAFGFLVLFLLRGPAATDDDGDFGPAPWLEPIIKRCIAANPIDRYESAIELLDDLEAALHRLKRGRILIKRHQLALTASLFALVIAGLFIVVWKPSGASRSSATKLIVMPSTSDPLSRMLADLIAVYLETEHVAVSRTQYLRSEPALDTTVKPDSIAASLSIVEGHPSVHLRFTDWDTPRRREIVVQRSDHIILDSLARIASEVHLSRPNSVYDVPAIDNDHLLRFAEAWQMVDQPGLVLADISYPQGIAGLLLKAKVHARSYMFTTSLQDRAEALSALEELRKIGVVTSQTILLQSALARAEGNSALNIEILRSGLKSVSTVAPIYRALGENQLAAGFAQEASGSFYNAIAADPYSSENYVQAAKAYTTLSQPGKAVDALQRALQLDPSNNQIYSNLGVVYIRLSRFEDGRHALERAVELKPTPEATVYLGQANLLCGYNSQAILLLKGAAAAKPSLYSLATLGAALRWVGDSSAAKAVLRDAKKLGNEQSNNPFELARLAMVHAQLGDIRKADALMARATKDQSVINTDLIYASMIIDAFASRRQACKEKFNLLGQRRFPMAFAERDPKVAAILASGNTPNTD